MSKPRGLILCAGLGPRHIGTDIALPAFQQTSLSQLCRVTIIGPFPPLRAHGDRSAFLKAVDDERLVAQLQFSLSGNMAMSYVEAESWDVTSIKLSVPRARNSCWSFDQSVTHPVLGPFFLFAAASQRLLKAASSRGSFFLDPMSLGSLVKKCAA